MEVLSAIFSALDGVLPVITDLVYNKAFDSKVPLRKRILYLFSYIMTLLLIMAGLSALSFLLFKSKKEIFGVITIIIAMICFVLLLCPFLNSRKK